MKSDRRFTIDPYFHDNENMEEIKNVIVHELPPEFMPRMDSFVETMNGIDYRLPTEFDVSDEALEKYTRFVLKDDDLEIKFDKTDFGVDENNKIRYNRQDKSIRIRLTDKQAEKFDDLLGSNNSNNAPQNDSGYSFSRAIQSKPKQFVTDNRNADVPMIVLEALRQDV